MPSYISEFNSPNFVENYLTSTGGDYENSGSTHAEMLPAAQEGFGLLFPDLVSSSPNGEGEVHHMSRPSNDNALIEPPSGGSGNWLGESYYFDDWWGQDQFSSGYGVDTFSNAYGSEWEKAEDPYLGEEQHGSGYFSYDSDVEMQPAYDDNIWSWTEYGGEEDYNNHGTNGVEAAYSYSWDEMKLCESIFGHWPCLLDDNQETYVDQ